MNKRKASNFSHYSIILFIFIFFLFITKVESIIQSKHKHPGSIQSGGSNIEIEPLNKINNNNDINLNPSKKEINTNSVQTNLDEKAT